MEEISPALKAIFSLGLMEASFLQNQPAWLVRGDIKGASQLTLHVFQGGWLVFSSTSESLASKGITQMLIISLAYLFIKD